MLHPDKWKKYAKFLSRNTDKNIFVSDEMFGTLKDTHEHWELLKLAYEGFHVRIIVTYRRYYEWFLSYYFQSHVYGQPEEKINKDFYPDIGSQGMENHKGWTNRIPTIGAYFDRLMKDKYSMFYQR